MTRHTCKSFENSIKHQMRVSSVQRRDMALGPPSVKAAAVGADDILREPPRLLGAGALPPHSRLPAGGER